MRDRGKGRETQRGERCIDKIEREREVRERQTDRQTGRQAASQTDRQTDKEWS